MLTLPDESSSYVAIYLQLYQSVTTTFDLNQINWSDRDWVGNGFDNAGSSSSTTGIASWCAIFDVWIANSYLK